MGTETRDIIEFYKIGQVGIVKLNNPLMGTETLSPCTYDKGLSPYQLN